MSRLQRNAAEVCGGGIARPDGSGNGMGRIPALRITVEVLSFAFVPSARDRIGFVSPV
jgi:hypothetical protein